MFPQYKDYNEVKVILYFKEPYIVSSIHKNHSSNDNSHLQSLSIEVPSAGDKSNAGCFGSISLVDYRNELFTRFITYQTENRGTSVQIPLEIVVNCFTRKKSYSGVIDKWSLSFDGAVPTIDIQWKEFPIFPSTVAMDGTYFNPSAFIDAAVDMLKHSSSDIPKGIVYIDPSGAIHKSSEFDNIFEFLYPEDVGYVLFRADASEGSRRGTIYSALNFFRDTVKLKSDTDLNKLTRFTYLYNVNNQMFEIRNLVGNGDESNKTSDKDDNISELAFILNGSKQAYSKIDDRYIIPMTSFSFSVDQSNAILMYSINSNPNRTTVSREGEGVITSNASQEVSSGAVSTNKNGDSSGNIEISFECYNVMSFVVNEQSSKIYIRLFTEFGEEHPITRDQQNRYAMVKSVKYNLSGAVIKANVTATQVYNKSSDIKSDKTQPKQSEDLSDNS